MCEFEAVFFRSKLFSSRKGKMLKLLCLGLFLSLCFEAPLSSAEDSIVRKVRPFETKEKRAMALRQAQIRSREERREERREPRIVGGHEVPSPNPYPWVANFLYGCDAVGFSLCGATLIQSNVALSAAHCWPYECPPMEIRGAVSVGLDLDAPDYFVMSGILVVQHPGFDETTNQNDLSLIFFSYDVGSVPKFPRLPSFIVDNGVLVEAAGWGTTSFGGDISSKLRQVTLKIRSDSKCESRYDEYVSESQLCAGGRNKDTCQGDGGGPLFETTDCCPFPSSILHGITSYGGECAITKTAVYTEVFYYLDWINSTISEQGFQNNLNAKSCCGCTGSVEEEEDGVNCASSGGSLGSSNGNQT